MNINTACPLCTSMPCVDEQFIFANHSYRIVWANDSNYPCFIRIIWLDHLTEMTDLSSTQQHQLLSAVLLVERVLRTVLRPVPDKINLVSLGNQIPHIHWHIIPRYYVDAHWPNSPFGIVDRQTPNQLLTQLYLHRQAVKQAINHALTI